MRYGANIEGAVRGAWTERAEKKLPRVAFICSIWIKCLQAKGLKELQVNIE